MDLEYYTTHRLTKKSDVYSFGMLMLGQITSRKPREIYCERGAGGNG